MQDKYPAIYIKATACQYLIKETVEFADDSAQLAVFLQFAGSSSQLAVLCSLQIAVRSLHLDKANCPLQTELCYLHIFQNLAVLTFYDARWESADDMVIMRGNNYRGA